MQLLFALLLSMGITVLLVPPLMRAAGWLGVLDQPDARKVHAQPIPRVGGIAMAAGLLVTLLIWGITDALLTAYAAATLVLLVFGVLDDRLTLTPGWKVTGQLLAAAIIMYYGDLGVKVVSGAAEYPLAPWLSLPLTLFFIVGVTNAINLADGLDGLAGGTSLICMSGLTLLALAGNNAFAVLVSTAAIGAVLGFLRYNTHPARVFMGDAGSQLLGFTAAVLSLAVTQSEISPFSAALPLLLLGVPVIDTLTVMTERVLDGKSPFKADRTHVHHRLLALGFHHHEAVMVIYGVQALLLVSAWQLRYTSDLVIILVFAFAALSIVTALRLARLHGWRWRDPQNRQSMQAKTWLLRQAHWLLADERLSRWCETAIGVLITAYVLMIVINDVRAPSDIRVLAVVAAVIVSVSAFWLRKRREGGWLERCALYVGALIAVFLDRSGQLEEAMRICFEYLVFGLLALTIVIHMNLSVERRFRITPLDLLVLVAGLALPNLPGSVFSGYAAGWTVIKVLLLLYGIETLSVARGGQWRMLTGSSVLFLIAVALRAAV